MFFFCFFFKQKTAYEMRISDWSSDVCSSDLQDGARAIHGLGIGEHPRIEHDDVPIVLHTHAGMAELGDPHAVESRESAPSWQTETAPARAAVRRHRRPQDRKSDGEGQSVSVRVELGGRRIIKNKTKQA